MWHKHRLPSKFYRFGQYERGRIHVRGIHGHVRANPRINVQNNGVGTKAVN